MKAIERIRHVAALLVFLWMVVVIAGVIGGVLYERGLYSSSPVFFLSIEWFAGLLIAALLWPPLKMAARLLGRLIAAVGVKGIAVLLGGTVAFVGASYLYHELGAADRVAQAQAGAQDSARRDRAIEEFLDAPPYQHRLLHLGLRNRER
jgi:hypothetical protein